MANLALLMLHARLHLIALTLFTLYGHMLNKLLDYACIMVIILQAHKLPLKTLK